MENTKALSNMNKKELYDHCKYLQSKIDEVKPIIHNFMDANLLVKVADNLFAMPDFTKVKEEHEKLKKENKELKAQIKIKDECLEFINNEEEQSEELCDIIEKLKEENHKLQKINKLYEERCENLEEMSKTRNEMVMKYKSFVENVMEKSKQNQE